MTEYKKDS